MEATSHLLLLLRDGRRVFPLRRADLRDEVRQLDIRRVSGGQVMMVEDNAGYPAGYSEGSFI